MCCIDMCNNIPKRIIILSICLLTNAAVFALRAILPMTIMAMSAHPDWQKDAAATAAAANSARWSTMTQGLLLAAYFIGHLLGMLPFNRLIRRFGSRVALSVALALAGVCTAIIPCLPVERQRAGDGPFAWNAETMVFVMRVLSGLGCSAVMPAFRELLRVWLGPHQQPNASVMMTNCANFGIVGGILVSGLCTHFWRWQAAYYLIGGFCVFCALLYVIGIRDNYEDYPGIGKGEMRLLSANGSAGIVALPAPWREMLKSSAVWAIWLAEIGHAACYYLFALLMPRFMGDIHQLQLDKNTYFEAALWLLLWLSTLIVIALEQYLQAHPERYSEKCIRLSFTTIGCLPVALCLGLAIGLNVNRWYVVLLLALAMIFKAAAYAGFRANAYDLSDNFADHLMTVTDALGLVCAIVLPLVWGATVTDLSNVRQYAAVWYGTCGLLVAGNLLYAVMSSGDPQWWDGLSAETFPRSRA